jgi:hypothetical protein
MIEKDGVKLTNDRDKAEVLNNFFISDTSFLIIEKFICE